MTIKIKKKRTAYLIILGWSCILAGFLFFPHLPISAILIIIGIGLSDSKEWARILLIFVAVLWLILGMGTSFFIMRGIPPRPPTLFEWLLFLWLFVLPSIGLIVFLNIPKVRAQFKSNKHGIGNCHAQ